MSKPPQPARGPTSEAGVVNAYVLPLPRGAAAVVDCDLSRLPMVGGRVRLVLYSRRPPSESTLAAVRDRLVEEFAGANYAAARTAALSGVVFWWAVLAALTVLVLTVRAVVLGPSETWAAAVLAGLSLPFGSGFGLNSWRAYRVARLARRVHEVVAQSGEQPALRDRLDELWRQYDRMHGREIEVVRQLEDACRDLRWSGAAAFYARKRAWLEAGTGESARPVSVVSRLWGRLQGRPVVASDVVLELRAT